MPNKDRWLVAVGAGCFQFSGIQAAKTAGLHVLAVDGDPDAIGLSIADRSFVIDIRNSKEVLARVKETGIEPSGAIALVTEAGMAAVAELRRYFELPGADYDQILRLTNKALQRQSWDAVGLPNPCWQVASTIEDAFKLGRLIDLPVIIKPVDGAGSRGVSKVKTVQDFEKAVHIAFKASQCGDILIESVLPGTEYTVETFSHSGDTTVLTITEKSKVPGSNGTVAYELTTADLPSHCMQQISDTAVAALNALGYDEGPGHTEIMYSEDTGPGLVEVAGRGPGFYMFDRFIPKATHYDIVTNSVCQAVGLKPKPPKIKKCTTLMRYFPSREGYVKHIEGFSAANNIEGIEAGPFVEIDQHVGVANCDGERLGYILSSGCSISEVRQRADKAESLIHFEIS